VSAAPAVRAGRSRGRCWQRGDRLFVTHYEPAPLQRLLDGMATCPPRISFGRSATLACWGGGYSRCRQLWNGGRAAGRTRPAVVERRLPSTIALGRRRYDEGAQARPIAVGSQGVATGVRARGAGAGTRRERQHDTLRAKIAERAGRGPTTNGDREKRASVFARFRDEPDTVRGDMRSTVLRSSRCTRIGRWRGFCRDGAAPCEIEPEQDFRCIRMLASTRDPAAGSARTGYGGVGRATERRAACWGRRGPATRRATFDPSAPPGPH